jgi:hypothetical protein
VVAAASREVSRASRYSGIPRGPGQVFGHGPFTPWGAAFHPLNLTCRSPALAGGPSTPARVLAGLGSSGFARRLRVTEVPLAKASLDFLGYPREIRLHPASDTEYSYAERSMTGPYARAAGNYTRYGDVRTLLSASDDHFVVFGSGEGVKLDFNPKELAVLPAGWVRDYFFYADGFEKDLDFYAAHAFTVEPLPKHTLLSYPYAEGNEYPSDAKHLDYQLEYNTRQRSDHLPPTLRYRYP